MNSIEQLYQKNQALEARLARIEQLPQKNQVLEARLARIEALLNVRQ